MPFPEFIGATLINRLAVGVDELATRVPSLLASIDRDAMVDEPRSNRVLHAIDAAVERLTILDQRTELTLSFRRHVDRLEFIHGGHASQLESVVFVRLAFDVRPLPSVFVGRADEGFVSLAASQIVDPARRSTSFHDNQIDGAFLEDSGEILSVSSRIEDRSFTSNSIEKAAHGIELAEIEGENLHVTSVLWVWGGRM